jgi:hypothetical protein
VSAPARASDTCKAPSDRSLVSHPIGEGLRALDMNATLSTMESKARSKLQALLENDSPYPAIAIELGMHYLDQHGSIAVARERMTVTMTVEARQPASDTAFDEGGHPCGEFCAPTTQWNLVGWVLLVRTGLRWQYTATSGATFIARSTDEPDVGNAYVTYSNGSWSLVQGGSMYTDVCVSPSQFERISQQAITAASESGVWVEGSPSANGCVIEFSPQDNSGARPPAQLLFRLGVLLAVNGDAQPPSPICRSPTPPSAPSRRLSAADRDNAFTGAIQWQTYCSGGRAQRAG